MILFLDFDGVLHPQPCMLAGEFYNLPRLENVLRDYPQVRIVVSSMWRYDQDLEALRSYFSEDIRPRVFDITPKGLKQAYGNDSVFLISAKVRHEEILDWLKLNHYSGPWVALDDSVKEFPNPCLQLVACHTLIGFDGVVELKLRDYLDRYLA